jgi:parallel beta-helix repeat protein
VAPADTGAALYISANGSDSSGNGSAAAPFATLARAQQAMEASATTHTTYVEAGTYNLTASLVLTSADNNMSFIAAPGQTPVLNGASAGLVNLITLNGAQNVTLQGLTFENTTPGVSNGAVALDNATGNTIVDNLFTNNDRGVLLVGSGNNMISGNEINGSLTAGINAGAGSNNNTIDSNLINGVGVDPGFGTGTGSSGIWITGGDNNAITHNLVENTAGTGIALENWDTNPADTTNLNIGNTIAYNSIVAADSSSQATDSGAIYIDGRAGVNTQTTINNNSVNLSALPTNDNNVGIYLDDFTSGVTVTNNITTGGNFAFLIHGGENDAFTNNIFDSGSTSASNLGTGLLQSEAGGSVAAMTGDVVSKNILYSTATVPTNAYVVYGGAASVSGNLYYNTSGQSISTAGLDTNPYSGNPQFANEPAGNYALGSGSAATAMGFQGINQSAIGLAPTTTHWY